MSKIDSVHSITINSDVEERPSSLGRVDTVAAGSKDEKRTWFKVRDEVQQRSIDKFRTVAGFECSVGMIEQSINTFKTDVFNYKLLANAYQDMAQIFQYQYDFQNEIEKKDEKTKKAMERSRENILKPKYFCIKFTEIAESSWMRFLSGRSFVYRGDTTMR